MAWNDGIDKNSATYSIASDTTNSIRVLAGPGTGKSFALKRKVAKLLEEKIEPNRILPITFTRIAAEDLQRELQNMGVKNCDKIKGWTIHSLALSILLREKVAKVIKRFPRLLSSKEIDIMLSDLEQLKCGTTGKRNLKKLLNDKLSAWASLQDAEPGYTKNDKQQRFENGMSYWLNFHKAMLIGEVIPILYEYFKNNPGVDELNFFDYVLVDEYQDLNKAEQSLIKMLSKHGKLCIVGDDDQSIYSFKNAHPEGIRKFKSTRDHELLFCHRCPTDIVDMANSLISKNRDRIPRKLKPLNEKGKGECHIFQFSYIDIEIEYISKKIQDLIINKGIKPGEILVLAQSKFIGNKIFNKLKQLEVPVVSYYQESQLDTEKAREALSYLQLMVNRNDVVSLRSLLGYGIKGYRSIQYVKLMKYSDENKLMPYDALTKLSTEKDKKFNILIDRFNQIRTKLEFLEEQIKEKNIKSFLDAWLPESEPELSEIRKIAQEAVVDNQEITLRDLKDCIQDLIFNPEIPEDVEEVRIMSIHKSKGLSARVVSIVGCIDGLLPKYDEDCNIEEQRRLFYVGLTRVKSISKDEQGILFISSSINMETSEAKKYKLEIKSQSGYQCRVAMSPFIGELGEKAPRCEYIQKI